MGGLWWSLGAHSRHRSGDVSHADDDEIKPANIQTSIVGMHSPLSAASCPAIAVLCRHGHETTNAPATWRAYEPSIQDKNTTRSALPSSAQAMPVGRGRWYHPGILWDACSDGAGIPAPRRLRTHAWKTLISTSCQRQFKAT